MEEVTRVVTDLLAELDRLMPEEVEGFYLVGSLALADYRPGMSDIDFIAVLSPEADAASLTNAHSALAQLRPAIDCDGIYLRRGELSRPPAGVGPAARGGIVNPASDEERHPVTWLTLLRHGITVRGRTPSPDWIATDTEAAIRFSRQNLASYWRPWIEQRRDPELLLDDSSVAWGVLGVARLRALIDSGQVLSKSGAGLYALSAFPQHETIIEEALLLRQGEKTRYPSRHARAAHTVAFMEQAIGTAL